MLSQRWDTTASCCTPEQSPVCCDAQDLHILHLFQYHTAICSWIWRSSSIVQRLPQRLFCKLHTQLQRR
jgi:hypothetical protein